MRSIFSPANDPTGKYVGLDDALFTLGGGLIGATGQAISNVVTGQGLFPANSGRDYTTAFVGGAAGGEALLYSPLAGPAGPFLAGAAGGLASNLTKQAWNLATQQNYTWDLASTAFDTTVGTLTGLVGGIKIPGLSAGSNSFNAIFEQITTKFSNGTISNLASQTALKMFAGANADAITPVVNTATSLLDTGYDWASQQLSGSESAPNSSGAQGNAAAGGFLIYPNQPNTNDLATVYQK